MGYRPSLRETSRKTRQGAAGSGGGSSRVCRLSSPIWEQTDEVRSVAATAALKRLRSQNKDFYLHVWVDKLKHRSESRQRLLFCNT